MDGETDIEMCRRHIREGTAHIARQREIIAELGRDGHPTLQAEGLLAIFEKTQQSHLDHFAILETEGKLAPKG